MPCVTRATSMWIGALCATRSANVALRAAGPTATLEGFPVTVTANGPAGAAKAGAVSFSVAVAPAVAFGTSDHLILAGTPLTASSTLPADPLTWVIVTGIDTVSPGRMNPDGGLVAAMPKSGAGATAGTSKVRSSIP